ncbi:hypothetical protein FB45DRAFT_1077991, partial [Roridomyces roridus]
RDDPCVQYIGSLEAKAGRCIAFPNIYQHRVITNTAVRIHPICRSSGLPFKLTDNTEPGIREILVFLVDPSQHFTTFSVAPQQLDIVKHILRTQDRNFSRLSLLPLELLDYIAYLVPGFKSRAEADTIREELMKIVESVNRENFAREFNMCEH